jgi:hypothetical protein
VLRASSAINLVFYAMAGSAAYLIAQDVTLYTSKFDCYQAMASVNEQDFESFSCKVKYLDISTSVEALFEQDQCPLNEMREAWEHDLTTSKKKKSDDA